jgi:hypothetical protein
MSKIKDLDDVRDLALIITDELVNQGIIKDCIDTDDDTEFAVQDIIMHFICKRLNIKED